jgi:hypothetical protein
MLELDDVQTQARFVHWEEEINNDDDEAGSDASGGSSVASWGFDHSPASSDRGGEPEMEEAGASDEADGASVPFDDDDDEVEAEEEEEEE